MIENYEEFSKFWLATKAKTSVSAYLPAGQSIMGGHSDMRLSPYLHETRAWCTLGGSVTCTKQECSVFFSVGIIEWKTTWL